MIKKPRHFTSPPVSKYFRFDWQYAIDIYKATALQFISLILLILSLVIDSQKISFISIPIGFAIASLIFIIAMLVIYLFSPRFIREYRDYGQYKARQHSHRWIAWEFYNNLKQLAGRKTIVRETVAKGISIKLESFEGELKTELERGFNDAEIEYPITVYEPININRDLYIPFRDEGQKFILFLEEDDKKLSEKEKELFWILFTQCAKEKVVARVAFWILIIITIFITLVSVVCTIIKIASK